MEFYYWSIFSLIPLGIAYGVLALLFWAVVVITRRLKRARAAMLLAAGVAFLFVPFAEELWIAFFFGQACKSAGTFINKTVQVDGFYDDTRTTHANARSSEAVKDLEESGYRFVEMRGKENIVRLEKINGQWNARILDRPTARYWFQESPGERETHKVGVQQSTVTDTQSGEVIARYVRFHRQAPWYFVSIAAPAIACDKPGARRATSSSLIYRKVLLPITK